MQDLSREAILRMIGLHDAAHLSRQLNAIQLSLEEENGKMVSYWTEIRKTEKEITLIAGRMDDAETDIAQLQVTAQQISASVSSLQTTVGGHTEQIASLTITTNSITQSVSSLTTTVNGHTSQISTLRTDLNGISATVTADHTTLGTHTTQIGSLQVTTNSISQEVSNISDEVDTVSGTVTTHTSQISTLRTDLNGISATVTADHTTLGTHTTQIGSLQVTTNSISGRVTAIEGDYVKEAEISLMVKKDGSGYISNASIKADNIDFTFTRATNFISGGKTVMSIDNGGNLWLLGEFRGGTITQNVLIGADSSDALYKMVLYTDEKISSSLPWLSSGIRGVLNSTVYLDIGFAGVGGQTAYPRITLNNGGSGSSFKYTTLSHDRLSFGSSSTNRLIIGYPSDTSRIYIHGNYADWYKDTELSSIAKGDVYIDSNGFLKVKNY